jgi:YfiH family protein
VRCLSSLRCGGVSEAPYDSLNLGGHVGDVPQAVRENRERLKVAARLPREPDWLNQVHGKGVRILESDPKGAADGAVTRQPGRVCAVLTADCLPVVFTTDSGEVIAAAHAGWRGLAAGILEATVGKMRAPAPSILAWLGPAIGPKHFEVGSEVREAFLAESAEAAPAFVANERGRFLADLYALARFRLARIGVKRVYGGDLCTFADKDRYFSHRRDGKTGRQATLIWLENR